MSIANGTKRETHATRWGKSGDFDRHSFTARDPVFSTLGFANMKGRGSEYSKHLSHTCYAYFSAMGGAELLQPIKTS